MATVVAGYAFTSATDPFTFTKLNLLGTPTVTVAAAEVGTTQLAANISISGLTIAANTPLIGSASTETFGANLALTFSTAKGNLRLIPCTAATSCFIGPSGSGITGTAGQHLYFRFTTDGTGGNIITYGSPFKSIGTHTLTGANKAFTSHFISDGTNWLEVSRTAALS